MTGWPANKLLVIKSPLIDAPVGLVFISKAGFKESNLATATGEILMSPFRILGSLFGAGSKPEGEASDRGRVISNLWVNRQGNCALYSILQKRFYGDGNDSAANEFLNIRRIDIGSGNEIVSLQADGPPAIFRRSEFRFTRCSDGQYKNCPEYIGQEFVLRRDWQMPPSAMRSFAMMPSSNFKVRYVFNSHTQIAEIPGGDSVAKVFSSCR